MAQKAEIDWTQVRKLGLILLLPVAVLATCVSGMSDSPKRQQRELTPSDIEDRINRVARDNVKARLRDGDSAKFRNQFVGPKGAPCGEVNARNAFGGYTGYIRFVASGGGLAVLEEDMSPDEFEEVWRTMCR